MCLILPRALKQARVRVKVYLLAAVTLYDRQQTSLFLLSDTKPC